jgi:hypothetical protein
VRRRRPAGSLQVPIPAPAPAPQEVREPAVVRIGPDRTLLDPPWDLVDYAVAHVWTDDHVPGGWMRVAWPSDPSSGRPIAPLDLHLGHVLELSWRNGIGGAAFVYYACIADVDHQRIILVRAFSLSDAVEMARRVVDVWRAAELATTEERWCQRIELAQHS